LFPASGCWGRPSWQAFRELFLFGKDLFLVSVGGMLLQASQTLIITRRLGLELAAVWAVGTKAYSLVVQLIWRTTDAAGPGFGEMLTRREETVLLNRYRMVVMLSASLAGFCAVTYVLCNSPFVMVWTGGKIVWHPVYDLLLGACLIVSTVVHSHTCFIGISKRLHFLRYISFIEGLVFVTIALLVAREGQLFGIILTSLICSVALSGTYTTVRIMQFFHLSFKEVVWEWLLPMESFLWRAAIVGLAVWYGTYSLPPLTRVILHAGVSATLMLFLLARYGVPASFQEELLRRAPLRTVRALSWLFGATKYLAQAKLT
jgi:O-antigen/teichoic acid export membrane protein